MRRAVAVCFAFHCQFDQTVNQFVVRQPAGFPKFGIHADLREAGDGVQLVEINLVRIFFNEEIDARHACTINGLVGTHGIFTNTFS